MNTREVMKAMGISRSTLYNYRTSGKLKYTKTVSGRFNYDDDCVYELIDEIKNAEVKNVVSYLRVEDKYKDQEKLTDEIKTVREFAKDKLNQKVNAFYTDVAKDGQAIKQKDLFNLIKQVFSKKVKNVIILNKDVFGKGCFDLMNALFRQYGTKIIVINEIEEV